MSSSHIFPKSGADVGLGINTQSIGADAPLSFPENVFPGVRPMIVTKDNEAADAHAPDTVAQEGFHKVSGLQVTMSNAFIE